MSGHLIKLEDTESKWSGEAVRLSFIRKFGATFVLFVIFDLFVIFVIKILLLPHKSYEVA
jgi:hypothetical protein